MPVPTRRFAQDTVTAPVGVETYVDTLTSSWPMLSAHDLHAAASRGDEVEAGPMGYAVATLRLEGGLFRMTRRDAADAIVHHSILADHTDAARLAQHWSGFCAAAYHDHVEHVGRYRSRA